MAVSYLSGTWLLILAFMWIPLDTNHSPDPRTDWACSGSSSRIGIRWIRRPGQPSSRRLQEKLNQRRMRHVFEIQAGLYINAAAGFSHTDSTNSNTKVVNNERVRRHHFPQSDATVPSNKPSRKNTSVSSSYEIMCLVFVWFFVMSCASGTLLLFLQPWWKLNY